MAVVRILAGPQLLREIALLAQPVLLRSPIISKCMVSRDMRNRLMLFCPICGNHAHLLADPDLSLDDLVTHRTIAVHLGTGNIKSFATTSVHLADWTDNRSNGLI